jgi:tRNA (guanosine-2'-O-)-methyltransferase
MVRAMGERGMLEAIEQLSGAELERIVELLAPYLTAERVQRLEGALGARTRELVVVAEDLDKEHNLSAVIRSAEAFGLLEVHAVPKPGVELKITRRVSIGSEKWIDLFRHETPLEAHRRLRARGYEIWAADVHGEAVSLEDVPLDRKLALVFGNEKDGLDDASVRDADRVFSIPMHGLGESLNVGTAAAVSIYDLLARKRRAGLFRGLDPVERLRVRAAWYALSVRAAPELLARDGLLAPRMASVSLVDVDLLAPARTGRVRKRDRARRAARAG